MHSPRGHPNGPDHATLHDDILRMAKPSTLWQVSGTLADLCFPKPFCSCKYSPPPLMCAKAFLQKSQGHMGHCKTCHGMPGRSILLAMACFCC